MADLNGDILVKIPNNHLPKLAALYEKHVDWAPHVISLIHTAIKWKKSQKYRDCMSFFSPNNSWEVDGTIIVLIECHSYDVFVFTLDDKCASLHRGLTETTLINYDKFAVFFCVHQKHVATVKTVLEEKQVRVRQAADPFFMYSLPPEAASNLTIEVPPDVYVKKLDTWWAPHINAVWPHKFPGSEHYLSALIEVNGGYGVFLKGTDELVAWVLKHVFGHIGMLQTDERHKKKGYGSLVAKVLAKEIGEEGHWPFGTVLGSNRASVSMFEKLGFRKIGRCAYLNNAA